MTTFKQMYDRINSFNVVNESLKVLSKRSKELVGSQREQMMHGKNAEGKNLGVYRSAVYAAEKNSMNPLPGFSIPDLKDTGDFHRGIFVDISKDSIIFDSTDSKTEKLKELFDRYGSIFGLSKDYKTSFSIRYFFPDFSQLFKEQTGCK